MTGFGGEPTRQWCSAYVSERLVGIAAGGASRGGSSMPTSVSACGVSARTTGRIAYTPRGDTAPSAALSAASTEAALSPAAGAPSAPLSSGGCGEKTALAASACVLTDRNPRIACSTCRLESATLSPTGETPVADDTDCSVEVDTGDAVALIAAPLDEPPRGPSTATLSCGGRPEELVMVPLVATPAVLPPALPVPSGRTCTM